MLPAPSKARLRVSSPFVREIKTSYGIRKTVRLERMGYLYIFASLIQACWPALILKNWSYAWEWIKLPLLGWPFVLIWCGMLVCIPYLFYVGCRLVSIGRDPHALVHQSRADLHLMGLTAQLLVLGILLDVVLIPVLLLLNVKDAGTIIFLSGLMGGRVLQANMEAILKYYGA